MTDEEVWSDVRVNREQIVKGVRVTHNKSVINVLY